MPSSRICFIRRAERVSPRKSDVRPRQSSVAQPQQPQGAHATILATALSRSSESA
jgi:hypothetical protein